MFDVDRSCSVRRGFDWFEPRGTHGVGIPPFRDVPFLVPVPKVVLLHQVVRVGLGIPVVSEGNFEDPRGRVGNPLVVPLGETVPHMAQAAFRVAAAAAADHTGCTDFEFGLDFG